ncbi:MAG: hypothetical protein ACKVRP_02760 [Bacteroidota bacterium]
MGQRLLSVCRVAAVCFLVSGWTTASAQETDSSTTEAGVLKEEVEHLKGVVNDLSESATEYKGYVDFLRKIKLTGYIQAQFRLTDANAGPASFAGGNFPANTNKQIQIRRGRLKVNYDNVLTQYVLQIDAIPAGVSVRDAFASITEPWLQSFGMQVGLFDRPFGYEISMSSSVRESPERSRLFQTLFPGERDIGAKLFYAPQIGNFSFLRVDAGVFNGTGLSASDFDNFKDIIGHVGIQIPFEEANASLDLGLSGYFGKVRNNTKYVWEHGTLASGLQGFVLDSSAANQSAGVSRTYLGFDLQFYYDVPLLGGLTLRGEVIAGTQPGASDSVRVGSAVGPSGKSLTTSSPGTQALGPIYKRDFLGWYVYLIQNIGSMDQIILKYDVYDPNADADGSDFIAGSNLFTADVKYSTLAVGLVHHWDENVKFVFYYESIKNERLNSSATGSLAQFVNDVKDNVFTFRTQVRF